MSTIPAWFPDHPPLYDIHKNYEDNFAQGPFFDGALPERTWPAEKNWIDFLGVRVASRIGVPAGPLLNSRWTTLAAQLEFDIVTYKTIRTEAHPSHPLPNIVYIDTPEQLNPKTNEALHTKTTEPRTPNEIAITNSFGMPSQPTNFLLEDIDHANRELHPGQALVVSVVGTHREHENFVADFARAGAIAKEAGAKIVEANFSCPNVTTGEGSIFQNPETVAVISAALAAELGNIPLIIKIGYFADTALLKKVLLAAARAGVRAIAGINTIGRTVLDTHGAPALGADRKTSGICGSPIRSAALELITQARTIIDTEKLGLTLIGVGGITAPEHFDEFRTAGADFAQTATGMMWNPYLAHNYHIR